MFRILAILSCLPLLLGQCNAEKMKETSPSFLGSEIIFATKAEASKLLGTSDEFTRSMTAFDFAAKTQNKEKNAEHDYLSYAAEQASSWSESDIAGTIKMLKNTEESILNMGLKLNLPKKVTLVLSSCDEEGGAEGYTREDYIVFKSKPTKHLFLHELWHVISRDNPELRDEVYKIIGFKKMDKIQFPEELESLRITNPDAPFMEHYITLDTEEGKKDLVLCTMASAPYSDGSFFQYLMIVLYEVNFDSGNPEIISSPPYDIAKVRGFREQVGNNTNYIIHPEEITAEHFTHLVTEKKVKNPEIIEAFKVLLKK